VFSWVKKEQKSSQKQALIRRNFSHFLHKINFALVINQKLPQTKQFLRNPLPESRQVYNLSVKIFHRTSAFPGTLLSSMGTKRQQAALFRH